MKFGCLDLRFFVQFRAAWSLAESFARLSALCKVIRIVSKHDRKQESAQIDALLRANRCRSSPLDPNPVVSILDFSFRFESVGAL